MASGHIVLFCACRNCGHLGTLRWPIPGVPKSTLAIELAPRLRCSVCQALGQVEVRLAWTPDEGQMAGPPDGPAG